LFECDLGFISLGPDRKRIGEALLESTVQGLAELMLEELLVIELDCHLVYVLQ